jgi:DNA invertase Pin-like site-specific DNA recombinase
MKEAHAKKILSAYAISYLRFSSVIQGKGDSSTRQNASRDRWLEAHPEIPLKREMNDLGLSAFSGKHVAKGDLGDFLALCETKEFRAECARRDVYLLVENLDRLSRERILKALAQLEGILESGVKVVTLCDLKTYDSKSLDNVGEVMMAICAMARAHEESLMKSIRISSAWKKRRKQAAEEGRAFSPTSNPSWIRVDNGKMKTIPEAVKIVRRVFELACEGKGVTTIARIMNNEGHPSLNTFRGRKKVIWNQVTVKKLIRGRTVIGEIHFHKFETDESGHPVKDKQGRRKRIPAGEPVKDYFPTIIDPATRAKANKIIIDRPSRGKTCKQNLNLFGKIAFDRKTGEPIYVRTAGEPYKNGRKWWQYVPKGVREGIREGEKWVGRHLDELFFATITQALNVEGSVAGAEADLALAEEQLADVQTRIRGLEKFLTESLRDKDFDPSGIREQMTAQQKVLKFKKEEIEKLKDEIHAGAGAIRIDPNETNRAKLIEVIRANVERIDLDCDKQEFRCVLMNGIEYEVKKEGEGWSIESDHFEAGDKKVFTSIEQLRKLKKKAA